MQRLKRGVHIVVGTPGRILDMLSRGSLKLDKVKWLVLDEADEMLSMGFIQDVEKILDAAPKERQTAFFSATMEASIRKLVSRHLRNPVNVTVEQPKATPKRISQGVYMIPRGWSKARALQPIRNGRPGIALILCGLGSRLQTHQPLQAAGHSVRVSRNLNQAQRERCASVPHVKSAGSGDGYCGAGFGRGTLDHVILLFARQCGSYVHRIDGTGRLVAKGTARLR